MDENFAPGLFLSVEDRPVMADIAVLEQGLFEFESARLGAPGHAQMTLLLRDGGGRVVAGIDGHFMWHRLFIKTMWIDRVLRGQGHGGRLIAEAEAQALKRDCRGIWLTALGARACAFYTKCGYRVIGELVDYVGGQSLYTVEKRFS